MSAPRFVELIHSRCCSSSLPNDSLVMSKIASAKIKVLCDILWGTRIGERILTMTLLICDYICLTDVIVDWFFQGFDCRYSLGRLFHRLSLSLSYLSALFPELIGEDCILSNENGEGQGHTSYQHSHRRRQVYIGNRPE